MAIDQTLNQTTLPARGGFVVTPADSDLTTYTRGICFATAGALRVTFVTGDDVTFPSGALAAGVIHPLAVKRVWSTSTTAASIVGIY